MPELITKPRSIYDVYNDVLALADDETAQEMERLLTLAGHRALVSPTDYALYDPDSPVGDPEWPDSTPEFDSDTMYIPRGWPWGRRAWARMRSWLLRDNDKPC